jgi:hypothetical protein
MSISSRFALILVFRFNLLIRSCSGVAPGNPRGVRLISLLGQEQQMEIFTAGRRYRPWALASWAVQQPGPRAPARVRGKGAGGLRLRPLALSPSDLRACCREWEGGAPSREQSQRSEAGARAGGTRRERVCGGRGGSADSGGDADELSRTRRLLRPDWTKHG